VSFTASVIDELIQPMGIKGRRDIATAVSTRFAPRLKKSTLIYPNLLFSTLFYIIVVRPTALEGPSLICDSTAVVPA